jgi:ribonuclease T1
MRPRSRLACAVLTLACAAGATFAQPRAVETTLHEIAAADLPREARETLGSIRAGGPFPFERDGVRFGNREELLPQKPRDYYREYTVRTPGARNRGARRLVCGGPPRAPDACYYTDDHYRSFAKVRP